MNTGFSRKTTPKVKDGKVQRKNKWEQSPNYYIKRTAQLVIERKKPGKGFRHLLEREDIEAFIDLIPDWEKLSPGLNAVVLTTGDYRRFGYHVHGVVHVSAWDEDLWQDHVPEILQRDLATLELLKVPMQKLPDGNTRCYFSEENAKAFQLLSTFLHELGHHHDCITNNSRICCPRGEPYAEAFEAKYRKLMFSDYVKKFNPTFAK